MSTAKGDNCTDGEDQDAEGDEEVVEELVTDQRCGAGEQNEADIANTGHVDVDRQFAGQRATTEITVTRAFTARLLAFKDARR
ncbi:hypothetical protein HC891_07870 [Candidatus Gracilibacteria bacterium]|nr:hypothetical protein [Candidatus Gracilibacteria bacterium]